MGILKCHSNSDLTVYYAVYDLVHVITLMACVRKGAMGAWYLWNLRTSREFSESKYYILAPKDFEASRTDGSCSFKFPTQALTLKDLLRRGDFLAPRG